MSEINEYSTQISKSISIKIDVKDILELLSKYDKGKSELISQIKTLNSKIVEYETQLNHNLSSCSLFSCILELQYSTLVMKISIFTECL